MASGPGLASAQPCLAMWPWAGQLPSPHPWPRIVKCRHLPLWILGGARTNSKVGGPPCPRHPTWQGTADSLAGSREGAALLREVSWGGPLGLVGNFLQVSHSERPAMMSVKSRNISWKRINKERKEMEIVSPWKLGGRGAGLVLRGAKPTHLRWRGEGWGSFRMREVRSGCCGK